MLGGRLDLGRHFKDPKSLIFGEGVIFWVLLFVFARNTDKCEPNRCYHPLNLKMLINEKNSPMSSNVRRLLRDNLGRTGTLDTSGGGWLAVEDGNAIQCNTKQLF